MQTLQAQKSMPDLLVDATQSRQNVAAGQSLMARQSEPETDTGSVLKLATIVPIVVWKIDESVCQVLTMTPYLVRVRIPDLGPSAEGAIALYVAMFDTEQDALDAVRSVAPNHWRVDEVLGRAADTVVERRKLKAGSVEQL